MAKSLYNPVAFQHNSNGTVVTEGQQKNLLQQKILQEQQEAAEQERQLQDREAVFREMYGQQYGVDPANYQVDMRQYGLERDADEPEPAPVDASGVQDERTKDDEFVSVSNDRQDGLAAGQEIDPETGLPKQPGAESEPGPEQEIDPETGLPKQPGDAPEQRQAGIQPSADMSAGSAYEPGIGAPDVSQEAVADEPQQSLEKDAQAEYKAAQIAAAREKAEQLQSRLEAQQEANMRREAVIQDRELAHRHLSTLPLDAGRELAGAGIRADRYNRQEEVIEAQRDAAQEQINKAMATAETVEANAAQYEGYESPELGA